MMDPAASADLLRETRMNRYPANRIFVCIWLFSFVQSGRRKPRETGDGGASPVSYPKQHHCVLFSNPEYVQETIKDEMKTIKEIREKVGLSQREFGKRIGKTGSYISQAEAGKTLTELEVGEIKLDHAWYNYQMIILRLRDRQEVMMLILQIPEFMLRALF